MRQISTGLVLMAIMLIVLPLAAQDAISAKAGLVNYFEGKVLMNGEELEYSITRFHQIPNGGILETPANGRAEVLLSPGVMLWLGEGSRMELVSDKLDAAEVRLLSGNAVVSSTEFPKDTSITILVNEDQVRLNNAGVYRLAYLPAKLEVQEGQADVLRAGVETRVKKGRFLMIDQPGSSLARIDKNEAPDPLSLWAESRDNYIQLANLSAARTARTAGGFSSLGSMSMLGAYSGFGGWMFNPYFGMYTFVPFGMGFASPFGGYFWGPSSVFNAYAPFMYSGGGWGAGVNARAANSRNSISRSGFSNNAAYGDSPYGRGSSSMGRGAGMDPGGMPRRGGYDGGFGGMGGGMGGYSRGSSGGGYSRGSVGGGGGGVAPSAPAASSSGGASMGRGGGGGGGRGN